MIFCKLLHHRKCKQRRVGGQNKTNLVNVVYERPLTEFTYKETKWLKIAVAFYINFSKKYLQKGNHMLTIPLN